MWYKHGLVYAHGNILYALTDAAMLRVTLKLKLVLVVCDTDIKLVCDL